MKVSRMSLAENNHSLDQIRYLIREEKVIMTQLKEHTLILRKVSMLGRTRLSKKKINRIQSNQNRKTS